MIEDVFLFEDEPFVVILYAAGEFAPGPLPGGRGKPRPSPYWPPPQPSEDDIEEQLAQVEYLAMLQRLGAARGVKLAQRLYQKGIDDARALSLLSAQRNAAIAADPLHRPRPMTAASLQKHLREEREKPNVLPPGMGEKLAQMKRDAALEEANRVQQEKRQREEEIRKNRLANLEKARKARQKK